jgi:membrane-bound serine protease (ClpP class)
MINGFITLFTETDLTTWIVLVIGLVCLIIEMVVPSFGLIGIGGIIFVIASLVMNVNKPWLSASELVFLTIDTVILFAAVLAITKVVSMQIRKHKKRKGQEFLNLDGKKVPADKQGNPDFSFLKNKAGICITDLNPSGKVEIDGEVYNVLSEKEYLYNGNMVRVVKTVGHNIYVKKINQN